MNPRNIISNIIMIFNNNSTRGHTGSLLVHIMSGQFTSNFFIFNRIFSSSHVRCVSSSRG